MGVGNDGGVVDFDVNSSSINNVYTYLTCSQLVLISKSTEMKVNPTACLLS
jgi:hypothetical protein